ncbi:hypothetical protein [Pedobacter sp. CFBP9032]|uniref:hypothetical protein n=1 Tax=Pedobacter sp. CFBP9032 TaxID=3096539 RepID=UPI002A6AF23C|nr:hypothetical protein [Pedobacter sp. CFBP9032]MDY0905208.1 hypothetical protein [Pedobacter sp. CFBP9032]
MKKITLLFLTLFCFIHIKAQDSTRYLNLRFIDFYRENHPLSYIAPLGEIGSKNKYVFTARLTTPFMAMGTKWSRLALAIIPDFTIRMLRQDSKPVYTPDLRIGAAAYYRLNNSEDNYKYVTAGFMHHSNGQDETPRSAVGTLNYENWDFSTNYAYFRYNWGKIKKDQLVTWSSWNHQIEFKNQIFNYDSIIKGDYGFSRVSYKISYRDYVYFKDFFTQNDTLFTAKDKKKLTETDKGSLNKERFRWDFDISYAINKYSHYNFLMAQRRLNVEAAGYYSPKFMRQVAFTVNIGYYGEDPYNIYFKDRYAWVRAGIAVGFLKYTAKSNGYISN